MNNFSIFNPFNALSKYGYCYTSHQDPFEGDDYYKCQGGFDSVLEADKHRDATLKSAFYKNTSNKTFIVSYYRFMPNTSLMARHSDHLFRLNNEFGCNQNFKIDTNRPL